MSPSDLLPLTLPQRNVLRKIQAGVKSEVFPNTRKWLARNGLAKITRDEKRRWCFEITEAGRELLRLDEEFAERTKDLPKRNFYRE